MRRVNVYISGPISGLRREEYMYRFADVAGMLERRGYKAVNPTRLWPCRWRWVYPLMERVVGGKTAYRCVLAYDLWKLWHCDGIFVMCGSERSRGARLERRKAREWGIDAVEM